MFPPGNNVKLVLGKRFNHTADKKTIREILLHDLNWLFLGKYFQPVQIQPQTHF